MIRKINNFSFRGLIIWLLAVGFYFFDNLLNVSPAAMKPELSMVFKLSAADLGVLASCYLWSYGLMQIPVGLLMDKYGPRRLLALASLLCAMGSIIFGYANKILPAQLARVLIGIGASFAVVGCSKIATIWFDKRFFALFMGLMASIGMLGGAFGLATVGAIIHRLGWRESMFVAGGIAFVLAILIWLIIRDRAIYNAQATSGTNLRLKDLPKVVMQISRSWQTWVASLYAGLMFVPTLALGGLWGLPYLVEGRGIERNAAGALVSLVFIGWVFGAPFYGWWSDRLKKRNLPMFVANICSLVISLVIILVANLTSWQLAILLFGLGFFSSGFILAFVVAKELHPDAWAGTAIGFINTINTFSAAALQWIIGGALDLVATGNLNSTGEITFSYSEYQIALLSIPVCLLCALIILTKLKETYL